MAQTILEVLRNQGAERSPSLLPDLERRTKAREIVTSYGTREDLMIIFDQKVQNIVCKNPDVCFFGGAPMLAELNMTYGENTAAMWLSAQLFRLSEYSGAKEKLTAWQIENCASAIADEFYGLSVTELMLFFKRFMAGRYGKFYGAVDPLTITTALREKFLPERAAAIDRHEEELRQQQREADRKEAVSWEDYCMMTYGEIKPHPLAINKQRDE